MAASIGYMRVIIIKIFKNLTSRFLKIFYCKKRKHCRYKPGSVLAGASACHLSTAHVAMRL